MKNPKPSQIARARAAAGLTQAAAAALVHTTGRVWRQWEAGDRRMHPAFWELFQAKKPARAAATCPECERSNGPHYRGPCVHV